MKGEGYYGGRYEGNSSLDEAGVMTCAHCQTVLYLHDVPGQVNWKEDGGWCRLEQKPLCGPCADRVQTHGCESIMRKIERAAERAIRRQQYERIIGV